MTTKKKIIGFSFIALTLLFTACTMAPGPDDFVHNEINFGKAHKWSYKDGVVDGCSTAKGTYKKNHEKFKEDIEYYKGWFAGRRECQGPIW